MVRFANINTTVECFYSIVSDLVMKLVSQGFSSVALRKKFVKFYHSKLNVWCKFGVDINERLIKLFVYTIIRLVYKIPYRRARAWPSGFRPSASREQRYLAYNNSTRFVFHRNYYIIYCLFCSLLSN